MKMKDLWAVGVREYDPGSFRVRVERIKEGAQNPFDMAGTQSTHSYVVHATVRADEKQIAKLLTSKAGWKQPGDSGQDRFSKTCSKDGLNAMLGLSLKAVGFVKDSGRKVNPDITVVADKLGVNAHGKTAQAVVTSKLMRLAKTVKAPRRQPVAAASM